MKTLACLILSLQGEDSAKEALRRLSARLEKAETLSCKMTQSRTTALLEKPLVSKGTLYYRRNPGRLVFRLTEPRTTEIHLDRTTYQVYRPSENRLERTKFEDEAIGAHLLDVFRPKVESIEKRFTVKATAKEDGETEIHLVPTDDKIRRRLAALTLTVHGPDATLRRIVTTDADGDTVRLDLTDLSINPQLPKETFDLKVPEGTRVLQHSVKK